jgi:aryl-alcohol dehydrogenase-like predicted oxidoreductase
MIYRKLGNSDIEVTPISFGAWAIGGWMWGGSDRKKAIRALEASIDLGITSIDTAPVYGFGLSEEIVGEVISRKRDKVQIMTKFGLIWDTSQGEFYFSTLNNEGHPIKIHKHASKESIILECEQSLKRLQTDYIDLYQIHWPVPTSPIEETMEAVDALIKQGKIRAAGVSNFSTKEMEEARKAIPIASNQVPYSMVKRKIEDDVVPYCIENHVSIIVYSPLQRGILSGKFKSDHEFGEGDSRPSTPYYTKNNIDRINSFLDQLKPLARAKNASMAQLVIRWTIQQPGITTVLAGIRDEKQLIENAGSLSFNLSDEEMQSINIKLEHLKLEMD